MPSCRQWMTFLGPKFHCFKLGLGKQVTLPECQLHEIALLWNDNFKFSVYVCLMCINLGFTRPAMRSATVTVPCSGSTHHLDLKFQTFFCDAPGPYIRNLSRMCCCSYLAFIEGSGRACECRWRLKMSGVKENTANPSVRVTRSLCFVQLGKNAFPALTVVST